MRARGFIAALFAAFLIASLPGSVAAARPSATIDFSAVGTGNPGTVMPYDYFGSRGLVMPPRQCSVGSLTHCYQWFIGWIQGDDALVGSDNDRPIVGKFTHPVTAVTVRVAPGFQYKAKWILSAFDRKGKLVARKVVVESQDLGLPNPSSGYFSISISGFAPACRFSIKTQMVATSYPQNVRPEFGLARVSWTWAKGAANAGGCPQS